MHIAARIFVAVVFAVLAASFWATTAALWYEYRGHDWLTIATFYSHLFIFFPLFGTVALIAFFVPASVFVDLYVVRRVSIFGRTRFLIGTLALAAVSWAVAEAMVSGSQRSVFEVAPAMLAGDRGEPAGCDGTAGPCERLPVMTVLSNVRNVSQVRIGLTDLTRDCNPDPLIEWSSRVTEKRYCFVTTIFRPGASLSDDASCCRAQRRFVASVNEMNAAAPSLTGRVHRALLPLKVFFLLVLLIISLLLMAWPRTIRTTYRDLRESIDRGVLAGAAVMMFFPAMNHGFLEQAALVSGEGSSSSYRLTAPIVSLAFGAWGLVLLFYYYRSRGSQFDQIARVAGLVFSAIAIVKYELIIDLCVRLAGSGATPVTLGVLAAVALIALGVVFFGVPDIGEPERAEGAPDTVELPEDQSVGGR